MKRRSALRRPGVRVRAGSHEDPDDFRILGGCRVVQGRFAAVLSFNRRDLSTFPWRSFGVARSGVDSSPRLKQQLDGR